ncbi:MAG: hypothetical protein ACKO96_48040, partial [Flammeovirgaceae bacterium]
FESCPFHSFISKYPSDDSFLKLLPLLLLLRIQHFVELSQVEFIPFLVISTIRALFSFLVFK